ncbi:MAG: D-glycero-beta-D-manno-heptose 1-phosphate adenylyltransferase [Cytophagales bacterium]|nr:D-glycero-beta-D-manno-heptose 1-phosphate adenylyltransferase [Flammeovirgaceae bacterium]PDH45387.1 MAG: D-glycero-beta-D-manno-heptose 1-phosphate adenylyltransferase [Rhodothermaeota bacterium MED-G18]|tara:strand:- start:587 stop:1051 length:465 start_codon:yes stop_codon:yes gene_type:complete
MKGKLSITSLEKSCREIRLKNKKIIFTNGCFDIIHPGHIHILSKAKSLGDILVVGLNSDLSVKKLKGDKRPLVSEDDRSRVLLSLRFVDYVIIFNELTPLKVIKKIKPDFLVKGGDYNENDIVGSDFVKAYGGQVEIIKFLDGYSSSNYIDNLN